jgi:outer membrane protein assembly factor BamD
MRQSFLRSAVVTAALLSVLSLGACSSDEPLEPFVEIPAEKLYNEGIAYLQTGEYTKATGRFDEVDKQHPYSEWARKALIMSAYTSYTRGAYDDAVISAKRYTTLYPGSEDAAYAQFIIGQSYFNQIPDVTRDQDMTRRALDAMNELVTRYPESPYASEGKKKMDMARDQLAGKEMETGRYYLNRSNYIAAINRFKTVVTEYQTTRHVEEALMRLTEGYFALGVVTEAQTAAAVLGHNYPDSRWYKDAYTLLQSGGLQPREDGNSWISKAFKTVLG